MQIKIRWDGILQAVEERERMKKELDRVVFELEQVRKGLSELSSLERQRKKIVQLEERIEKEGRNCLLFANTIANIYRLYQTNENRLTDYSETVRRMAKRESFSCQNLEGLMEIFYRILL